MIVCAASFARVDAVDCLRRPLCDITCATSSKPPHPAAPPAAAAAAAAAAADSDVNGYQTLEAETETDAKFSRLGPKPDRRGQDQDRQDQYFCLEIQVETEILVLKPSPNVWPRGRDLWQTDLTFIHN